VFEAEVELEKKSSSIGPLLLVLALLFVIVGSIGYFFYQSRIGLSSQEATAVVNEYLDSKGPAIVHFHAGNVMPSVDEKPRDPHYKLLEKAGIVTLKPTVGGGTYVVVTPAGQREFSELPGFKKFKNTDGTETYVAPLAQRKLVSLSKVTMVSPSIAKVEFSWKWEPTRLGEVFDLNSTAIKTFNTWDRGTLVQKYGADYYHATPTQEALNLVKTDKGWKISTE